MASSLLLTQEAPAPALLGSLGSLTSKLSLDPRCGENRREVEALIQQVFLKQHQAEIHYFLPELLSLRCAGRLTAAIGMQSASQGTLFLEQYLPAPIEQVLSAQTGQVVRREQILEIGNLVSVRPGSSLLLMVALSELIAASRFRWVTFTATSEVQSLLTKLHYQPLLLAAASVDKVQQPNSWGAYYQKQPKVMAGFALPAIDSARNLQRYKLLQHMLAPQLSELQSEFRDFAEKSHD